MKNSRVFICHSLSGHAANVNDCPHTVFHSLPGQNLTNRLAPSLQNPKSHFQCL
jgi:hypothetical protein